MWRPLVINVVILTKYYFLLTTALHSAFGPTLKKQPYYSIVTGVHSFPLPLSLLTKDIFS